MAAALQSNQQSAEYVSQLARRPKNVSSAKGAGANNVVTASHALIFRCACALRLTIDTQTMASTSAAKMSGLDCLPPESAINTKEPSTRAHRTSTAKQTSFATNTLFGRRSSTEPGELSTALPSKEELEVGGVSCIRRQEYQIVAFARANQHGRLTHTRPRSLL